MVAHWILAAGFAVAAPATASADTITIARLQWGGGGDWYVSPSALPNLLGAIRDRTGIPVAPREATVRPLDPSLSDYPFLYMTGHGNLSFSPAERLALREHLLAGGFLLANDSYGLAETFRAEMAQMFPESPLTEIPPDHPIFHSFYDFPDGLPKIHEHDGKPPQAFGIFRDARLLVLFVYESDIGDGWENPDVHDDPPEIREQALRMGVNIFVHVLSQEVR
jgi:hypothetical protein